MQMSRASIIAVLLILACSLAAHADLIVLQSGKTIKMQSYSVEGPLIHITLNANGEMSIPVQWVREIRATPSEPVAQPATQAAQDNEIKTSWQFAYSDTVLPLSQKHAVDWK